MKNKLTDLNNHLFEQLERLNDPSLIGSALSEEISRSKAVANVAVQIISNGDLLLRATIAADNFLTPKSTLPEIMGD